MTAVDQPRCRCGHRRDAHEHYRRGTDCAVCGAPVCPRFRPERGVWGALSAALAVLRGRGGR